MRTKDFVGYGVCVVLVGITHTILKIFYSIRTEKRLMAGLHNVPGARGTWLAGAALEMAENIYRIHEWKRDVLGKHKTALTKEPLFSNNCSIVTIDPKVVKHILKDHFDVWNKPNPDHDYAFGLLKDWIGPGIFLSTHGPHSQDHGQLWTRSRKTASAIFTRDNFNDLMTRTFQEQSATFLDVLNKVPKGDKIDMQQMFFAFTMDSIMRIFFGRETHTMRGTHDPYAAAFDDAHRNMLKFLMKNIVQIGLFDLLPWPLGPFKFGNVNGNMSKVYRALNKDGRNFNKNIQILNKYTDEIIDTKMRDSNLQSQRDLLSLFMNAQDDNQETYAQPKYRKFLRSTVLNFVIAGRDTTACTLTWMFFILSTNPEIQEKLCKEIDEVLQNKIPNHDDITPQKMPYLNGVLYEALRLYPPVPDDPKMASVDDILPDGTKIAAGTIIDYFPYGMGRDADVYPDPLQVKPERWIPFHKPNDFEFPIFQAGPRICLGMKMAILEVKILASYLLQKYTFTLLEGEAEKISPSLMITMSLSNSKTLDSNNLWLIPHAREQHITARY